MTVTRAVLYARVSTGKQAAEGVSLEAQEEMARRLCTDREWALTTIYCDVETGKNDRRPDFLRLQRDAATKAFDVLIVYKVDRLARSVAAFYQVLTKLQDRGIALVALTQPFDTGTPMGRAMLGMLAIFAEMESENTSERTSSALRMLAARGKAIGSNDRNAPLGYRWNPDALDDAGQPSPRLDVDPATAEVVRCAFDTYLATRSLRGTASHLNALGYTPKRGASFRDGPLEYLLRNPAYYGARSYGKMRRARVGHRDSARWVSPETWIVVDGAHEAIVSKETWQRVQVALSVNKGKHPREISTATRHPWAGLAHCAICGAALKKGVTKVRGLVQHWYTCSLFLEGGKGACDGGRVGERYLEGYLVPELARAITRAYEQALQVAPPRALRKAPDRGRQIASLEARREREKDLFRGGFSTFDEMGRKIKDLDEQIAAMTSDAPQPTLAMVLPADFQEMWDTLTPVGRGDLLRTLIIRLEASRTEATIHFRPLDGPGWPETLTFPIINMGRKEYRRMRVLPDS